MCAFPARGERGQGTGHAKSAQSLCRNPPRVNRALDERHRSRLDRADAAPLEIGHRLDVSSMDGTAIATSHYAPVPREMRRDLGSAGNPGMPCA